MKDCSTSGGASPFRRAHRLANAVSALPAASKRSTDTRPLSPSALTTGAFLHLPLQPLLQTETVSGAEARIPARTVCAPRRLQALPVQTLTVSTGALGLGAASSGEAGVACVIRRYIVFRDIVFTVVQRWGSLLIGI